MADSRSGLAHARFKWPGDAENDLRLDARLHERGGAALSRRVGHLLHGRVVDGPPDRCVNVVLTPDGPICEADLPAARRLSARHAFGPDRGLHTVGAPQVEAGLLVGDGCPAPCGLRDGQHRACLLHILLPARHIARHAAFSLKIPACHRGYLVLAHTMNAGRRLRKLDTQPPAAGNVLTFVAMQRSYVATRDQASSRAAAPFAQTIPDKRSEYPCRNC